MDVVQVLLVTAVALAVVAFVVWPMLERTRTPGAAVDIDRIERRILEYREALRRGTVCERCLYANPNASRFCAQCGARLAVVDTRAPTRASGTDPS